MIRIFKWWWAWDYEEIENWLEQMEAGGLRLVETRFKGVFFYFEKCQPGKARYCIDYQNKLTPDYMTIIGDDGWKLYQVGMGWYILRKQYEEERPELYTDFVALISRNKSLLSICLILLGVELVSLGNLIYSTYKNPSSSSIASTCILGAAVIALFAFIITSLALQIRRFTGKRD